MKDALRLALYFVATVVVGALIAPLLFWTGQAWFPFLAKFDFETFFHRALLIAAVVLLWPLLRLSRVRRLTDLGIEPNSRWARDLAAGFFVAAIPLLCSGAAFVMFHVFTLRHNFLWPSFGKTILTSTFVPLIEEGFFRGLVLGILLQSGWTRMSILATSALFSIVHFLKAPARTSETVTWSSGFNSIAHSFAQFADPILVVAAFTTLFAIGWILADARVRTRSLWLPIGLHAGWIFASRTFNAFARREIVALPWLGKNLLVGIVPLGIAALTWLIMRSWLKYDRARQT